jgi:M6 family metalloprotease-like protein
MNHQTSRQVSSLICSAGISVMATLMFGFAWASQPGIEAESREFFVPRAGYKRTVDTLAIVRALDMMIPGNAMPGQTTVLSNRRAIPTILVEFKNRPSVFAPADYQKQLFGDPTDHSVKPTLSQYYFDMSKGVFRVTGQVLGWYRLPNDDTYYETPKNGSGPAFGELLKFALEKADVEIDFGQFDNDGLDGLPNSGDDDGLVDTVFLVHSEAGAECNTVAERANVWSHSWYYSWPGYHHDAPFQTSDVRLDENQNPALNNDGSEQKILVEDYTVQPGIACPDSSGTARITPVGVFTHEYGHSLGLPDLYDRTPSGSADSSGIGNWALMAGGSWGFNKNPDIPTRMSAWSLARLGWANLTLLDPLNPMPLRLEPVQAHNQVYVVDVPGTNGTEYFLIEMKDPQWQHQFNERFNWDKELPEKGLAIWHVDDNVGATSDAWPFAPHDQGQNDSPSLPNRPKHALVALEQADCLLDLERRTNGGDTNDLWANGDLFGQVNCTGGSLAYSGVPTGLTIEAIDLDMLVAQLGTPDAGPSAVSAMVMAETGSDASPETDAGPGADTEPEESAPLTRPAAPMLDGGRAEIRLAISPGLANPLPANLRPSESFAHANETLTRTQPRDSTGSRDLSTVLTKEDQTLLIGASKAEIDNSISKEQQVEVKAWAAQQRQYEIAADHEPQSEIEEKLVDLQRMNTADQPIYAQAAPNRQWVEQVRNLNVPVEQGSIKDTSDNYLQNNLKPLVGPDVQYQRDPYADPSSTVQQYQQVHTVQGTQLPVFDKGASLYWDKTQNLTAINNEVVDPSELSATGTAGSLAYEAAKQVAARQMRLPAERGKLLKDMGEGIYLVNQDPAQARVVRRLMLPVSPNHADIVIYVDEETQSVIAIE